MSGALEAAALIGRRLSRDAIWFDGRCTWIGAGHAGHPSGTGSDPALGTLDADLSAGTAGVALFLSQLWASTRHPEVRRTAIGAARHSLDHAEWIPTTSRLGLYGGHLGVALAATRVGIAVDAEDLVQRAAAAATPLASSPPVTGADDLVDGHAGGVLALLALWRMTGFEPMRHAAVTLGEQLGAGLGPATDPGSGGPRTTGVSARFTGLAHGASGVALALLELFRVTGNARLRNDAVDAIASERPFFDPRVANWRHVRRADDGSPQSAPVVGCGWCSGAPGIAVARQRAAEYSPSPALRDELAVALDTTRRRVRAARERGLGDMSLCHGALGAAEILTELSTGDDGRGDHELGRAIAEIACDRARRLAGGSRPHAEAIPLGLMAGLAGTGYYLLRQASPTIPSILVMRSDDWGSGSSGREAHA